MSIGRYIPESSVRIHDLAFARWLEGFHVNYGTISGTDRNDVPILSVVSTPERPHGLVWSLLISRGWIATPNVGTQEEQQKALIAKAQAVCGETVPLPLLLIKFGDATPEPQGNNIAADVWSVFDETTQEWIPAPYPRKYKRTVTVTMWGLKVYSTNYFTEWLMGEIGKRGAAHNELFLNVHHPLPWGNMLQSLVVTSMGEAVEEQGEGGREVKQDYTFTMNMLVMHHPRAGVPAADTLTLDTSAEPPLAPTDPSAVVWSACQPTVSGNLWQQRFAAAQVPGYWPKQGDAAVGVSTRYPGDPRTRTDTGGLTIIVAADADAVRLFERSGPLSGGLLMSVLTFRYIADEPVRLLMSQRDAMGTGAGSMTPPDTPPETTILAKELPATSNWKQVEVFALATKPVWIARVAGITDDPQPVRTAQLVDIDVRRVWPTTAIEPTAALEDLYEWAGLAKGVYLLRATLAEDSGDGTLTLTNDGITPTDTAVVSLSWAGQRTACLLVSPRANTVRVAVAGLSLAALSLCRYAGPYTGSEV